LLIARITDYTFNAKQIDTMEGIMLRVLNFDLSVPTAVQFANHILKIFPLDSPLDQSKLEHMTHFLLELTLQKYSFLRYRPSRLAYAAVFLARKSISSSMDAWTDKMGVATRTFEADLMDCASELLVLARQTSDKCQSVRRKYSSYSKRMAVALLKYGGKATPALLKHAAELKDRQGKVLLQSQPAGGGGGGGGGVGSVEPPSLLCGLLPRA
jgi:hypothetical protein